ncbi:MAG: VanZ family protein, partial [Gemmatimonadetes bacterium]|nr:VanZ family protein [Gemmatimonadota bacterium]NNL30195.1 VanZ family protein [Gemmatimonadota bacterium]
MRILLGLWRLLVGGLWLAAVGALTLRGAEIDPERLAELQSVCVICGTRGTADAILNIVLFLPLGLVLGGGRRALVLALVAGATVAGGIELLQTLLPGRHPSPADVVFNAMGAALGTRIHALAARRVRTDAASGAGGTGWLWGGVVGACFLGAGVLLTPHPPDDDYWGQWMPDLGWMPQYEGVVVSAELNGRHMPWGRLDHEGPHRELLDGDWRLDGRIVVGPSPDAVSPILSIYDGHQREALLLGAHRDAIVFREWTIGKRLRFDAPDVRIPGAFGPLVPGDTTFIGASRRAATTCLRLGEVEWCGLGITPGRTWGFLLYLEGLDESIRELADLLWLLGLFLP